MSRTREAVFMGIGILTGLALCGPAAQAADTFTAALSNQPIYVDGQRASMTAFSIGGNNYVRLRDIGQAVDFSVDYDPAMLLTALLSWLFPLLARFENTFPRHLSNAVLLAVANLPVTFLITLVNLLPLLLALALPQLLGYLAAFWTFIGLAAGAYLNSFYLNRVFKPKNEEVKADE